MSLEMSLSINYIYCVIFRHVSHSQFCVCGSQSQWPKSHFPSAKIGKSQYHFTPSGPSIVQKTHSYCCGIKENLFFSWCGLVIFRYLSCGRVRFVVGEFARERIHWNSPVLVHHNAKLNSSSTTSVPNFPKWIFSPFFVEKPAQVISYQVIVVTPRALDDNHSFRISLFTDNLLGSLFADFARKHQMKLGTLLDRTEWFGRIIRSIFTQSTLKTQGRWRSR